jgi:ElaB/YqjD/DUF883 family membrane-anchored ribosome-binding protein
MNTQERNHQPALDRIATHAGQQIRETTNQLGKRAAQAAEELGKYLNAIEMKYNGVRDTVIDKTKKSTRTTNRYVGENPWVAIGISVGFAFVAGMLIGRRR